MKKIFISILIASIVLTPITFIFGATGRGFRSSGSFYRRSIPSARRSIPSARRSIPSAGGFRSRGSFTNPVNTKNQVRSNFIGTASPSTGASFNPFSGNFFLWYWLFGGQTSHTQNSTTTVETTTKQ